MTYFRLFQTERVCRQQFRQKTTENSPNEWKTLLEKEKFLVTSNFSFSDSVFKRFLLQTCKKGVCLGKG